MVIAGIVPGDLLGHVVILEGEDGETVDHHARCFGVEGDSFGGGAELFDEELVDLLDEVVAGLVVTVDGALGLHDPLGSKVIAAGDVLFVPEEEILLVVGLHQPGEAGMGDGGVRFVSPGGVGLLEGGDGGGVEFRHGGVVGN